MPKFLGLMPINQVAPAKSFSFYENSHTVITSNSSTSNVVLVLVLLVIDDGDGEDGTLHQLPVVRALHTSPFES